MIKGIWTGGRQFLGKTDNPKKGWNRRNKSTLAKLQQVLWGCLPVVLLSISSAYGAGTILENFTGSQVNEEFWSLYSFGEGTTGQIANDRAEASVAGNGYAGISSSFTLEGDFEMQVDFTLTNWPAANGTQLTIELYDQPNGGFFQTGRANTTSEEQYFLYTIDQISDSSGLTGPALSGKLRMVRTGETMEGFFWNGSAWQSIGSATNAMFGGRVGVSMSIGPYGAVYSGIPAQAAFDNIQVDYSVLKPGFGGHGNPLPALLLLDE